MNEHAHDNHIERHEDNDAKFPILGKYELVELELYKGKIDWGGQDWDETFESFAEAYKSIPLQERMFSGSWAISLVGDKIPFLLVVNGLLYPVAHIGKCPNCEGMGNVWELYPPFHPDSHPEGIECAECAGTGILAPKPREHIDMPPQDIDDIPF